MERYSQYRDRGSGIAPFFPITTEPSGVYLPWHVFLFCIRLSFELFFVPLYFLVVQWLPIGFLGKKAALWCILGTPGIWWIDVQMDGVRRGELARYSNRLPQPGSIIAASFTSPLDPLYIAGIFVDPIFTISYPKTRLVQRVSLLHAMMHAFSMPSMNPPEGAQLESLETILTKNPNNIIVTFPECTTTNGRGILPFSPSLLSAPPSAKIHPVSIRHTAADVTTPVPGTYMTFLWNLLSKFGHVIRVRFAEPAYNRISSQGDLTDSVETIVSQSEQEALNETEKRVLDKVGEALARLGRVKRVGLGVREKIDFTRAWRKHQKRHSIL